MFVQLLHINMFPFVSLEFCPENQVCIPSAECPFTRRLKSIAELSSNEDERNSILEIISSRLCGKPFEETVCCDSNKGMSFSISC